MSLRKLVCFLFTAFFLCSKISFISDVLASHDDFTDLDDIELGDKEPIKTAKTQQPKKTALETLDDLYQISKVPVVVAVTYSGDKCKAKTFGHAAIMFRIDSAPSIKGKKTYYRVDLRLKTTEQAESIQKKINDYTSELHTKTASGEDTNDIESMISDMEKNKDPKEFSEKMRVKRLCFSPALLQANENLKKSIDSYEVIYSSSFGVDIYNTVMKKIMAVFRKLDHLPPDPTDKVDDFNAQGFFAKNCLQFAEFILSPIPNPFITISFSKIPYFEQLLVENPKEGFFDIKYYCYRTGDCLASVNRLC